MPVCSRQSAPAQASPGPEAPLALVIQLARLGDFLQSTPLIRAVRQRHPANRVAALVTPAQAPLARACPELDSVLELEPGPLLGLLERGDLPPESKTRLWRERTAALAGLEVGQVYNLNLGPLGGFLGRTWPLAQAHAWRLRPELNALQGEPWSPFIMALAGHRRLTRLHLTDILSAYADPPGRPADSLLYRPPQEALAKAGELLAGRGPAVALQLGANSHLRRWPVEYFAELARELIYQGARPVLVGSRGEAALGQRLLTLLGPASERALNLMGRTSLDELGAVLARCALLVSGDTGTLHLGTAAGARVLALFMGPAQVHETGPYGRGHLVLQARDHCGPCQEQNPVCRGRAPCRRLLEPMPVIQACLGLLRGLDTRRALDGPELSPWVVPYESELGPWGQEYRPLRPGKLSAEEGLALGLKEAGLSLLYSAHQWDQEGFGQRLKADYTGIGQSERRQLQRHLDWLKNPAGPEQQDAELSFLAGLCGPKAPPRAKRALDIMAASLARCLEL